MRIEIRQRERSGSRFHRPQQRQVTDKPDDFLESLRARKTLENRTAHGKIDQWYSLEDRPGVVFILNMTDTQAAHAMLEELPLGKAHLMTFQLTPIGPLNPLRQLLVPAVPH